MKAKIKLDKALYIDDEKVDWMGTKVTQRVKKLFNPFVGSTEEELEDFLKIPDFHVKPLEILWELTPGTVKLYLYIFNRCLAGLGKDSVDIPKRELRLKHNIRSEVTLNTAVKELEAISFIKRKEGDDYWINPFYLTIGNKAYFKEKYEGIIKQSFPKLWIKYLR